MEGGRRLILWVVLLAVRPVAAQSSPPPRPGPDPGEVAYQEGRRAYDLREWDRAIAKFKEAYELRHDAASLFNIAQAYRLQGNCVEALGFYKTYSRNFPTARNLDKVQQFITELEPCASQQTKTVKTEPIGPADAATVQPKEPVDVVKPAPAPTGHRRLALGLAGGGGIAIVGAVVVGSLARSKWRSALEHCDADRACDPDGLALGDQARTRATVATVIGGVGVAALTVGTILFFRSPAVTPVAAPDEVGVAVTGRF